MTDYKMHLEGYQHQIREKITDIQNRMNKLNSDILDLSIYVQSGIFYNCINELEQLSKEQNDK